MSFAYLPLYTGDYRRDTAHLTPMRHGVYLLLLMHCWDQKGPLPVDEQECAGISNCRSADEIEALRYVLTRFFVRMEDGWYNRRMQAEVERAESISSMRSEAGRRGYEARAKHLPGKSRAKARQVHLTPPPTPSLSPTPEEKQGAFAPPDWVPQDAWKAWLEVRKRLKAPNTDRALQLAVGTLEKLKAAGHEPTAVLELATERGWRGLFAPKGTPDHKPGKLAI